MRRTTSRNQRAELAGGLADRRTGVGDVDRIVAEVRQSQVAQQQAAVGVRVGAHPPVASRSMGDDLRAWASVVIEQRRRPVAEHPLLEEVEVVGVGAHAVEGHLVRPPRALDLLAIDLPRSGPALGGAQDDHRPGPVPPFGMLAVLDADLADDVQGDVERLRQLAVDVGRVVAGDRQDLVPVALEQLDQLVLRDAGEHRRIGDLVAVEVEDRQDGAVTSGIEELVGVPAGSQRAGLGFAVADDAGDEQPGVVERRPVGVRQGIPELAALVDRPRHLRRDVAGDPAGEGELAEQLAHPSLVAA